MTFKELLQKYRKKFTEIWHTGKIQRRSRITYDIVWNTILFVSVVIFIGVLFGAGVGAGYFASLVKDEPIRTYTSMEKDIYNVEETSKLYFAGDVYIGDVRSDLHREKVALKDISPTLIKAVIATEDEYFYEHQGVVPKAIVRAILQEAVNSDTKSGGSTLTQQIIKNQILTNEVSFDRKAKEILLALRLERFFDKDEILESYLNIIPYGRDAAGDNIAGIQTASNGVFGIDAKELTLPQAAFLAGLPQSPSAYTPFSNDGGLKEEKDLQLGVQRMKTVLKRMYDLDYIDKEEYDEAIDYDITADFRKKMPRSRDNYPALTEEIQKRAKDILVEVLAEEDGYSLEDLDDDKKLNEEYKQLADRALEMNGYHIHSTINKDIFQAQQEVAKNFEHYGPDREVTVTDDETGETSSYMDPVQTGAMLIENKSGRIISFVGSREFTEKNQNNFATNTKRLAGSTIKPLLDYAPAMEKGVVQPGSVLPAYSKTFNVSGHKGYPVGNYGGGEYGLVSAREALAKSYNVPAVETYTRIINDDPNPAEEYLEKMGITSLTENDRNYLSLSLGSMDRGISVEENTNAFGTFANGGQFVDGYMIEKITTADGEIVYEHESEPVDVFSPQTAYLTIDMMRDVLSYGTAASLKPRLKYQAVDWAGKTGTSDDYKDAWFIGTNPNVTFGTWIGYDSNLSLDYCPGCSLTYSQRNQALWAELINAASEIDPDLLVPDEKFEQPDGIVSKSYCEVSGMLPSELCEKAGLISTDIYNEEFVPSETDDSLISGSGSYVTVNGKTVPAGSKTPGEFLQGGSGSGLAFNPDWLKRNGYDEVDDLTKLYPRTNREAWEKIGISSTGKSSSSSVEDTGNDPAAPNSLSQSGDNLSWQQPDNTNVVGYRIYKASESDGSFSVAGSTTSTSFSIDGNGVYHVKAVDYFGRESSASSEVTVGNSSSSKNNEPKDKKKDKQDNKKDEEKNSDQADDEESNHDKKEDDEDKQEDNDEEESDTGEDEDDDEDEDKDEEETSKD